MMNIKNTITKDHELLNNPLYNIFAVNLITHKKLEMTIQILTPQITIVTNIIKITITIGTEIMIVIVAIVENIRKTTIDQILDKDITIDLEVHIDLDLVIIIKEELYPDLHIDHHTETPPITGLILDQDIDLVLNHKEITLDDIIIHIDLHPNQQITDQDLEHLHGIDNKMESIKQMLSPPMTKIVLNLKFIHVKELKLQIQLHLIVGFIHYIYMLLKEKATYYLQN